MEKQINYKKGFYRIYFVLLVALCIYIYFKVGIGQIVYLLLIAMLVLAMPMIVMNGIKWIVKGFKK